MKKTEEGFSVIETFLVVVILVLIGGTGFMIYHRTHKITTALNSVASTTSTASSQTTGTTAQPVAPLGTTQSISNLTAQDISSESSVDNKYTTTDQTTAQSVDSSAADLGGAYNEANF